MFVFFGKRHDAIKVIFSDGSGLCLFYKRLDAGVFRVPELRPGERSTVEIDEAALDDLLDGIDVQSARSRAAPLRGPTVH
jgi:transposase